MRDEHETLLRQRITRWGSRRADMMGEVRRRDHGWAVKVPRRLKDLQRQLVQARGELSQRLGRAPTASEIADHLDIDHELVVEAVIAGSSYSTRSTDVQAGPDEEYRPFGETLGDVDPNLDTVIDVESVRPISRPCRTANGPS
jgi:RNA polymerase sigma-B factor